MSRVTLLRAEADRLRAQIDTLEQQEKLAPEAEADLERAYARLEELEPELAKAADRVRAVNAAAGLTAALVAQQQPGSPVPDGLRAEQLPSAGEWAAAFTAGVGKGEQAALDRLRAFDDLLRAPAQQAIADNSGAIPTPIIEGLVKFVDAERYLINALGVRPMWMGTGSRPRVTQTTQVGAQASEFTELSTRKMLITKDALTRNTYGGYVELSAQDQEFSDPGMLQILLEDLAEQYGVITDTAVATALVAAATNTFEMAGAAAAISTITVPATWAAALASASVQMYTQSKKLPTHLMVSSDVWGTLLGLVDSTGRPIYPMLNPENANGAMPGGVVEFPQGIGPGGLRFVCDPNFAANTAIVGRGQYAEVYEAQRGAAIGAFKPGTLATEVGFYGFLGWYMRAEGFVRLVNAV